MTQDQRIELAREWRAVGYSYREIAKLLGVRAPVVRSWLSDPQQAAYLQPDDVARLMGVSPKKVRAFIKSGELHASNASNSARPRFIIRREDFNTFLDRRKVPSAPASVRRQRLVRLPDDRY